MAPFRRLMMWILALKKQRPTDRKGCSTLTTPIVVFTDADVPCGRPQHDQTHGERAIARGPAEASWIAPSRIAAEGAHRRPVRHRRRRRSFVERAKSPAP